jgi:hypothetical protein
VRFQPNYKPIIKWRRTLCQGAPATGAARKKAIVAVARQLAVDSLAHQNRSAPAKTSRTEYLTNEFEGNRKEKNDDLTHHQIK